MRYTYKDKEFAIGTVIRDGIACLIIFQIDIKKYIIASPEHISRLIDCKMVPNYFKSKLEKMRIPDLDWEGYPDEWGLEEIIEDLISEHFIGAKENEK